MAILLSKELSSVCQFISAYTIRPYQFCPSFIIQPLSVTKHRLPVEARGGMQWLAVSLSEPAKPFVHGWSLWYACMSASSSDPSHIPIGRLLTSERR